MQLIRQKKKTRIEGKKVRKTNSKRRKRRSSTSISSSSSSSSSSSRSDEKRKSKKKENAGKRHGAFPRKVKSDKSDKIENQQPSKRFTILN